MDIGKQNFWLIMDGIGIFMVIVLIAGYTMANVNSLGAAKLEEPKAESSDATSAEMSEKETLCTYTTTSEEDNKELKELCMQKGIKRELATSSDSVMKVSTKEELEVFHHGVFELYDMNILGKFNTIEENWNYAVNLATYYETNFDGGTSYYCYDKEQIDATIRYLFNVSPSNVMTNDEVTVLTNYYCPTVVMGESMKNFNLLNKEETEEKVIYHYQVGKVDDPSISYVVAFEYQLVDGRYILVSIKES